MLDKSIVEFANKLDGRVPNKLTTETLKSVGITMPLPCNAVNGIVFVLKSELRNVPSKLSHCRFVNPRPLPINSPPPRIRIPYAELISTAYSGLGSPPIPSIPPEIPIVVDSPSQIVLKDAITELADVVVSFTVTERLTHGVELHVPSALTK